MPSVTIPGYNGFEYNEVWEILEWRNGCTYRTRNTGKFIHNKEVEKLDKKKYKTASLSTSLTQKKTITLELFTI